jgi:HPt (histidine-containing phosphotransfer) domain-containing protein
VNHQPLSPPVDIHWALRLAADDPELLTDLGDEFRRQVPHRLAELRRALEGGDAAAVWRVAHGLKGALATLAAVTACQQALELEALGRAGRLDAARERLDGLERELERVSEFLTVPGWSHHS